MYSEDLCKISKEYLNALTFKFCAFSGRNLETFDILYASFSVKPLKFINSQKQSGLLAHPVHIFSTTLFTVLTKVWFCYGK